MQRASGSSLLRNTRRLDRGQQRPLAAAPRATARGVQTPKATNVLMPSFPPGALDRCAKAMNCRGRSSY
jgi:hypothetical protein